MSGNKVLMPWEKRVRRMEWIAAALLAGFFALGFLFGAWIF